MISFFIYACVIYFLFGIFFAVPFCFMWLQRIHTLAEHASIPFRLLCIPGAVFLWPVLLVKVRHA